METRKAVKLSNWGVCKRYVSESVMQQNAFLSYRKSQVYEYSLQNTQSLGACVWPVPCAWLKYLIFFFNICYDQHLLVIYLFYDPTARCPDTVHWRAGAGDLRGDRAAIADGENVHGQVYAVLFQAAVPHKLPLLSPDCWAVCLLFRFVFVLSSELQQCWIGQVTSVGFLVSDASQNRCGKEREKRIWSRQFAAPAPFSMELMCVFSLCCVPFHSKCSLLQMSFCKLGVGENSFLPFVMFLNFTGISISDQTFAANISGVLAFLLFVIIKF